MKIVVEIPKDVKAVIDRKGTNETVAETLWQAVKNGTQLPEGHGRLIDADAYRKEMLDSREFDFFKRLDMQSTIIEADVPDTDAGNNDRNCESCKHHHDGGCDSWECEEEVEG